MKFKQAVEGFMISRVAEGVSQHTVIIYKWGFKKFFEFFGDEIDLLDIKEDEIRKFFHYIQTSTELSPESIKMEARVIHAFYTWATEELEINRPDKFLKLRLAIGRQTIPFNKEEIQQLMKACSYSSEAVTNKRNTYTFLRPTRIRDRALLLFLLDTGVRAGELCRLKLKDVDLETGAVQIEPFGNGLKSKSRVVYIGKAARAAIWRYLTDRDNPHEDEPLFIASTGNQMNNSSIGLLLRRIGQRAGVMKVHPHRFRHTFAIQYLRNGGDIFTLQRLLGHSSLVMVRHYLFLADTDSQSAHLRASPVDRWRLY